MEGMQIQLHFPEGEFWQWVEVYKNGAVIAQYDEQGKTRHFDDIDQNELDQFLMVHQSHQTLTIPMVSGRRLIHFFRNYKQYDFSGTLSEELKHFRFPVVGYQITKNDINFKVLLGLYPDGYIEVLES